MPKKWKILQKLPNTNGTFDVAALIELLLANRGIKTPKEKEVFLHPSMDIVNPKSVGIDQKQLQKAVKRIQKAIVAKEHVVVFGDYDVDGITGSAILWETLHSLGANSLPYIPDRKEEGYGLSVKGIKNLLSGNKEVKLIITVDNGIVASDAVTFANEQEIEVIITDHHTASATMPDAYAIVHTTNLCGAGVAYLLSQELRAINKKEEADTHLELAVLGTVADLVPLTGANRAIVTEGLKKLQITRRPGLLALFQQAGIKQETIGVSDIGYGIGPRLNASGRIESAMQSLRLLCTNKKERAGELAAKLEFVNHERQQLLKEAAEDAILRINSLKSKMKNVLIVSSESYGEGIIGLVAGKLVEAFYRPAIVLSLRAEISKASVRSISGFNIIEFLRMHTEHFVNVGGHPMAAGFTIETAKIADLQKILEEKAETLLSEELLTRTIKVDCELLLGAIDKKIYEQIKQLAPFGMGNPEPVFVSRGVVIENIRVMGKEANHLKLVLSQKRTDAKQVKHFEAVAFGMGALAAELHVGNTIEVAYIIDENTWNGDTKLQLKVRDIKVSV